MPCSLGVVEVGGKYKPSRLERWVGLMEIGAGLYYVLSLLRLVTERGKQEADRAGPCWKRPVHC